MGVSSKMIMTTAKNKDIFKMLSIVEKSLNDMLREERKKIHGKNLRPWTQDENNSNVVKIEVMPTSRAFRIFFKYKGEDRQLWFFTDCDNDNKEMTSKPNVFFSFNSWGNHKEILSHLAKDFMKVYTRQDFFFDFNDCDYKYALVLDKSLNTQEMVARY